MDPGLAGLAGLRVHGMKFSTWIKTILGVKYDVQLTLVVDQRAVKATLWQREACGKLEDRFGGV